MRKKIMLGFVFTTLILLITPIVTSLNKPIIKEQEFDIEKLEDITTKKMDEYRVINYITTMMSKIKNIDLDRRTHPCICTLLLLIFLPRYIYYRILYSIGITPYIMAYIIYFTFTISNDFYGCYWTDWFIN